MGNINVRVQPEVTLEFVPFYLFSLPSILLPTTTLIKALRNTHTKWRWIELSKREPTKNTHLRRPTVGVRKAKQRKKSFTHTSSRC